MSDPLVRMTLVDWQADLANPAHEWPSETFVVPIKDTTPFGAFSGLPRSAIGGSLASSHVENRRLTSSSAFVELLRIGNSAANIHGKPLQIPGTTGGWR
jgi:hypothetical protein